jgi:hypothetical protein
MLALEAVNHLASLLDQSRLVLFYEVSNLIKDHKSLRKAMCPILCSIQVKILPTQTDQQAEVILNHENENVRNIGQGEPRHRKYKRLKLGGGQAYDRSSD